MLSLGLGTASPLTLHAAKDMLYEIDYYSSIDVQVMIILNDFYWSIVASVNVIRNENTISFVFENNEILENRNTDAFNLSSRSKKDN